MVPTTTVAAEPAQAKLISSGRELIQSTRPQRKLLHAWIILVVVQHHQV